MFLSAQVSGAVALQDTDFIDMSRAHNKMAYLDHGSNTKSRLDGARQFREFLDSPLPPQRSIGQRSKT